jgi:hypothetical protein
MVLLLTCTEKVGNLYRYTTVLNTRIVSSPWMKERGLVAAAVCPPSAGDLHDVMVVLVDMRGRKLVDRRSKRDLAHAIADHLSREEVGKSEQGVVAAATLADTGFDRSPVGQSPVARI